MKLNRLLLVIVLGASMSVFTSASAQNEDASGNPDFSPVTKAVDTNNDGKMSREEWTSKGLPTSSFNYAR